MKIALTFIALILSTVLLAQSNNSKKTKANVPVKTIEKNVDQKIRYVDKRTKTVSNNSNGNSNSQANKKSLVRKMDNQQKTLSK